MELYPPYMTSFSWLVYFTLRVFAKNLLRENRWRNIFFSYFILMSTPEIRTQALRLIVSQHTIYRVRHLTFFFFQLVFISWMVTLSSCLIWQIISFILPPNEYGCVYAWTTQGNIATDRLTDADFGKKKIISSDEAHFDLFGYVNK